MPKKPVNQHDGFGMYLTKKGYWRFNPNGPMKHQYVHRYEAEKMLGRKLRKDEQVHHGKKGKRVFTHDNLTIIGQREHGWVSARQAFYMKLLDIKQEQRFYQEIAQFEKEGVRLSV